MEKLVVLISFLFIVSCGSKKPASSFYDIVRKEYSDYVINHNKKSLKKSYQSLIVIEDFKNNGITAENILLVIPILLKMEKYDELHNLLGKNNVLSQYYKEYYLNQTNVLKYRCKDIEKSNYFIYQNLDLIKQQMLKNKNDSILYVDYYSTKLYISDLSSILNEIDSLKKSDTRFTYDFYNHLLKQNVQEMNNKIERCK